MTDRLLELGKNPSARKLIGALGLPLPLPQKLRRAEGAWQERPLHDEDVLVASVPGGALSSVIATTLAKAGANPSLIG
ncbi:MAG: hypothetical protein RIF41_38790, partial [Polyangiaceae bacterium]